MEITVRTWIRIVCMDKKFNNTIWRNCWNYGIYRRAELSNHKQAIQESQFKQNHK
jgi:hypothetical protein